MSAPNVGSSPMPIPLQTCEAAIRMVFRRISGGMAGLAAPGSSTESAAMDCSWGDSVRQYGRPPGRASNPHAHNGAAGLPAGNWLLPTGGRWGGGAGATGENRTPDQLFTKQLLYR